MDMQQFHVVVALGITAISAGFDLATRKIPNTLTLGGIVLGFALNLWSGFAFAGAGGAARALGLSALGTFLSAFLPLIFFLRGEMGGGDVKLMAAIGSFVGPILGFQVLGYTYLCLLVTVLPFRLLSRGRWLIAARNIRIAVANVFRSRASQLELTPLKLPEVVMAPAIFAGFVLCAWRNWAAL